MTLWTDHPRPEDRQVYPDDHEGPETTLEAIQALRRSLEDLWGMTGQVALDWVINHLEDGIDAWHDWWKPLDLSGPWTKGWTPDKTLMATIFDELGKAIQRGFDALRGRTEAPAPMGIRGARPHSTFLDEVIMDRELLVDLDAVIPLDDDAGQDGGGAR